PVTEIFVQEGAGQESPGFHRSPAREATPAIPATRARSEPPVAWICFFRTGHPDGGRNSRGEHGPRAKGHDGVVHKLLVNSLRRGRGRNGRVPGVARSRNRRRVTGRDGRNRRRVVQGDWRGRGGVLRVQRDNGGE